MSKRNNSALIESDNENDETIVSLLPITVGDRMSTRHESITTKRQAFQSATAATTTMTMTTTRYCEIRDCQSKRKIVGTCTRSFCCKGGCQRPFCSDHDGKLAINALSVKYKGKTCYECAFKINRCRKVAIWVSFLLLLVLCAAVTLILIYFL